MGSGSRATSDPSADLLSNLCEAIARNSSTNMLLQRSIPRKPSNCLIAMPSGDPAHSRTTWTEGLHELLPPGVAALLLAVLVESAQAQTRWDGNRLYAICQQRHDPDSDCAVFIRGTIDRYHELIATHCAPQHKPFDPQLTSTPLDPGEHRRNVGMSAARCSGPAMNAAHHWL
jgi:hypothetical protein